jgi:hypothetical protein
MTIPLSIDLRSRHLGSHPTGGPVISGVEDKKSNDSLIMFCTNMIRVPVGTRAKFSRAAKIYPVRNLIIEGGKPGPKISGKEKRSR